MAFRTVALFVRTALPTKLDQDGQQYSRKGKRADQHERADREDEKPPTHKPCEKKQKQ
jgi:hypothetical protein